VFGFVTGMAFTFASESRSPSDRNAVRLPTGIAFGIDRIHQTGIRIPGPQGSAFEIETEIDGGKATCMGILIVYFTPVH
jgi:hypothetical protein